MGGACSTYGEKRGAYRVLAGRTKKKRPFGRLSHRREETITVYLKELEWRDMDWIDLVQERDRWRPLVNAVMSLRFP
jgi:hypothetical protein